MVETRDIKIKRLIYRSNKRGWKETDLLIGGFANENIHSLTDAELGSYDILLDQSDAKLFAWVTGKASTPEEFQSSVMDKLQQYKFAK
jgi:antitoxin CptB